MGMEFLNVLLDILKTPAILVGVFALIGLLLQKKEVSQVISGTLKTVLGFILITAGGNIIISSLDVFGQMFNRAFSISGVIPNNEAIVAVAQSTFGTQTALIMVFGMVVNLVLALFTPL